MKHSIPNLLTYSRIAVIPLFIAAFYMGPNYQWAPLGLFLYAAITDFFDGYLARKWNVTSDIGRVLDPIADKLLVTAALIMLLMNDAFYDVEGLLLIATLIILSREIFVSGLRESLENKHITLHVSKLGKWKTTMQMIAVGMLLFFYSYGCGTGFPEITHGAGTDLYGTFKKLCTYSGTGGMLTLLLATLLTVITGIEYTIKGFRALNNVN